jgi:hypothetical protein
MQPARRKAGHSVRRLPQRLPVILAPREGTDMTRFACVTAAVLAAGLTAEGPAREPADWKVLAVVSTVGGKQDLPISIDPLPDRPRHGVACRGPADLTALMVKDRKLASDIAEQQKAEAWAAKLLGVNKLDWTKQMVVAIDAGTIGGSAEVRVVSAVADGRTLTVTWQTVDRAGAGLNNPRLVALMPRFEGDVLFVEKRRK